MKRQIILGALVAVAALAGAAAGDGKGKGKQVHYVGIHPIAKAHGAGLCHIEVPHVHVYAPADMVQYRDYRGDHYFVGDPVAYGWEGDKHAYYGHHPIHVQAIVDGGAVGEPVYCYLDGPHYHGFEPPMGVIADFKVEADAYFYVGEPLPVYVEARPQLVKINAIYTPIEYVRPVVTVEPPSAWIGIRFPIVVVEPAPAPAAVIVEGPRARAGVEVVVPAVEIRPPSIEVGVGISVGGGVVVGGGHDRGHRGKKVKFKKGKRGNRR
jgi:hypothetical protein